MYVNFNSAYSSTISGGAGGKLYVPVNQALLLYSHFDHVSGFAANSGQNGISISKIRILNTLIERLTAAKSGAVKNTEAAPQSPEQLDALIENYQQQLRQTVKAAEVTPYMLAGARPETGMLFTLTA